MFLSAPHHVSFILNRFSVKCRFPFPILRFLPLKWLYCLSIIWCNFVFDFLLHQTLISNNGPWFTFPFMHIWRLTMTSSGFLLKPDDLIVMSSNVHEWKGKLRSIVLDHVWCNRSLKTKLHPMTVRRYSYLKSSSVTQTSVSQQNKSKGPSAFLRKTIGSNNSFTLMKTISRF